jgi:hypothetical protein
MISCNLRNIILIGYDIIYDIINDMYDIIIVDIIIVVLHHNFDIILYDSILLIYEILPNFHNVTRHKISHIFVM